MCEVTLIQCAGHLCKNIHERPIVVVPSTSLRLIGADLDWHKEVYSPFLWSYNFVTKVQPINLGLIVLLNTGTVTVCWIISFLLRMLAVTWWQNAESNCTTAAGRDNKVSNTCCSLSMLKWHRAVEAYRCIHDTYRFVFSGKLSHDCGVTNHKGYLCWHFQTPPSGPNYCETSRRSLPDKPRGLMSMDCSVFEPLRHRVDEDTRLKRSNTAVSLIWDAAVWMWPEWVSEWVFFWCLWHCDLGPVPALVMRGLQHMFGEQGVSSVYLSVLWCNIWMWPAIFSWT